MIFSEDYFSRCRCPTSTVIILKTSYINLFFWFWFLEIQGRIILICTQPCDKLILIPSIKLFSAHTVYAIDICLEPVRSWISAFVVFRSELWYHKSFVSALDIILKEVTIIAMQPQWRMCHQIHFYRTRFSRFESWKQEISLLLYIGDPFLWCLQRAISSKSAAYTYWLLKFFKLIQMDDAKWCSLTWRW